MPDVSEIIEEMESHGVPKDRVHLLAAWLIVVGERAALYRSTKGLLGYDELPKDEKVVVISAGRK